MVNWCWLVGCFVLRHINPFRSFNAESSHFGKRKLCFCLVWFYGMSTIVGYSMLNSFLYSCGPLHMDEQRPDDQLEPTYNKLCADTGCSLEDLPEAMVDKEGWRERVKDIHADGMTWWWWWWWFQIIQFSINTQFSSIWPTNRTLSGVTSLDQSGPGSDGNKKVLHIFHSSSLTGASPSDCLVSYTEHSSGWGVLLLCRKAFSLFNSRSTLGHD